MTTMRFTKDHEYVRLDGDVAVVGITEYAQEQLGDVVYVELPQVGATVAQGAEAAVVESVKAASEVYAPIGGEILEINPDLEGAPATINADPLGKGWFLKMKVADVAQVEALMTEDQYRDYLKSIG